MENQNRIPKAHAPTGLRQAVRGPKLTRQVCLRATRIGLGLCMALAWALAAPSLSRAQDSGQDLTIRWVDHYGLFDFGSDALGARVRSIFKRLGVRVNWIDDPNTSASPERGELTVVLRPSEPVDLGFPPDAMGVVFGAQGHAANIWIFFPTIVRTLEPQTRRPNDTEVSGRGAPKFRSTELERLQRLVWLQQERVARAMGAVVAHEVIHAVVPATAEHADDGLMSARLIRSFLVESKLPIDERLAAAFIQGLARLEAEERTVEQSTSPIILDYRATGKPAFEIAPPQ